MNNNIPEKCLFCQGELKYAVGEKSIYGHPKYEYAIMHEPRMVCKKCEGMFQSEPGQYEKLNIFLDFLKTVQFSKIEIEYKDMVHYVDTVLQSKNER